MGRSRIFYLIGAALLMAVAAGAVHNELLGPLIRAVPIRNDDPLTIRFAVFNPAFTVTLRDLDMTCMPQRLTGHDRYGHTWAARGQAFPLDVDLDVGPRLAFEYTCPIEDTGFAGPVDRVTAVIAIRYRRFARLEHTTSATLAWDSASRAWTVAGR